MPGTKNEEPKTKNAMQLPEMIDSEIDETAAAALELAMTGHGLNEWRCLFVTLRMVDLLMERTGCRIPIGVTVCQQVRELAGAEEMDRVEEVRRKAFAMARKARGDR
jgi:hypothetical protein